MRTQRLIVVLAALLALAVPARAQSVRIGQLNGANFNSTADQAIQIPFGRYVIRRITVQNCSTSLTLAVGGFYTAASKGGTAIVANTQVYTALTSTTKFLDVTPAAILTTDVLTAPTVYLSLTTGQGSAATCNVAIFGDILD